MFEVPQAIQQVIQVLQLVGGGKDTRVYV